MITERTLKKWRKEALSNFDEAIYENSAPSLAKAFIELNNRILRMTQELLDFHLVKDERRII